MHGAASSSTIPSEVQGICPTGWHVPSKGEWTQLTNYVSSQTIWLCSGYSFSDNNAKALASQYGWNTSEYLCSPGNEQSGNNNTGFSALPAGEHSGSFYDFGNEAGFWSTTECGNYDAWQCYIESTSADVSFNCHGNYFGGYKMRGFSVRCLRNENDNGTTEPGVTDDGDGHCGGGDDGL